MHFLLIHKDKLIAENTRECSPRSSLVKWVLVAFFRPITQAIAEQPINHRTTFDCDKLMKLVHPLSLATRK